MRTMVAAALMAVAYGGTAHAEPPQIVQTTPKPFAYGIFVGHNEGGPGQGRLRYAEGDARRVADTLRDLGHYGTSDLRVLLAPSPDEVLTALDVVTARLREHKKRGEDALLVFYFSGHAKANALHLGDKVLDIALLRDRLRDAPSRLTLVILDACQSGSFARAKGAEPAKDFSVNSVARLTTRGIAVMASSTSQELSQESDDLRSSYFTHHFVVGLRGAGDQDHDGKVTLDEAYRYAYRRTLAATEQTAVGGQHVTLETDLSGQGEVPLSFPREAKSKLELPAALDGRVLVQHRASGSVLAEIQKAKGTPTLLALPAGDYDAIVRDGAQAKSCGFTLVDDRVISLDATKCSASTGGVQFGRLKGSFDGEGESETAAPSPAPASPAAPVEDAPQPKLPPWHGKGELANWALELGFGGTWTAEDKYFDRLRAFGYTRSDASTWRLSGTVTRNFGRYFALGLNGTLLPSFQFQRRVGSARDTLDVSAFSGGGLARGVLPLLSETNRAWLELFAQASLGLAHSSRTLQTTETRSETETNTSVGGAIGFAAGGKFGGGFMMVGYDYAPALTNQLSDTHNVGGVYVLLGGRFKTY